MTLPVVSVLMAVHQVTPFLARAIESVLEQEGPRFEFVIVDDGSTDEVADVIGRCGDPRIVLINNRTNLGLTASLNIGLRRARGRFVARMDADDESLPGRLNTQAAALDRTGADICFCRCLVRDEEKNIEKEWRETDWPLTRWRGLFINAYGPHPAVMFSRRMSAEAGGYDNSFQYAQDYDLWDRCLVRGARMIYLPQPLLRYRSHDASITRAHQEEQAQAARIVSFRAMGRAFPDAEERELAGLRWLMLGQDPMPNENAVDIALANLRQRVAAFAAPSVWRDAATRLGRRLRDVAGARHRRCVRTMLGASLRSRSAGSLIRSVYATAAPRRV